MSSRLVYHPRGWARKHQQSATRLFIYVEGKKHDRAYYEELATNLCAASNIRYLLEISRNIPHSNNREGKEALKEAHRFLEGLSLLRNSFKGKKTAVLFFVDKDVDDLKGELKAAEGLVYTRYYNVENHIVAETRLGRAIALAGSADPQVVEAKLGDQSLWRYRSAAAQKKWVYACVVAQLNRISVPNYAAFSRVNDELTGKFCPTKWESHLSLLRAQGKLSKSILSMKLRTAREIVDSLYRSGRQDEVFKGNWYGPFLEKTAVQLIGSGNFVRTEFSQSIWISMISKIERNAASSQHFRDAITSAVNWLTQ